MSFAKPSLLEISKKQFQFKFKSYLWVFTPLVILQLLAVFFSMGGSGSMGSGRNDIFIQVHFYSADIVIAFTMLWAFIIATQMTSTMYKENEFMFVTNQLSNHLSDVAFLMMTSVISSVFALLSSYLIKVLAYIFLGFSPTLDGHLILDLKHVIYGVIATILFITLSSALGYVFGMFVQWHKLFLVVIPAIFFGLLYVSALLDQYDKHFIVQLFQFYFQEPNFFLFSVKVIFTIMGLFFVAILISKRLEVRR